MPNDNNYVRPGGGDTTARDLDRYVSSIDVYQRSALESAEDVYDAARLQRQSPSRSGHHRVGVVQYSLPTLGWYRVQLEDRGGVVPCCKAAADGSPMVVGVNDVSQLPPGAQVLVWLHPTYNWGVITSCIPWQDVNGNVCHSDEVVQGSGVGSLRDAHHANYINKLDDEGGVVNFRNHRPNDSLAGDWGKSTVTGVGLHLDPDMFYARVSEMCGVFGFAHDHFLRVAGFGYELVTACHQQKVLYDEGEAYQYEGRVLFPWEMLGSSTIRDVPTAKEEEHFDGSQSRYEPETNWASHFRYEEFGGYLGQGQIRQMRGELDLTSDSSAGQSNLTLFREHVGINGAWSVQSTNSLMLVKRGAISRLVRLDEPDSFKSGASSTKGRNYAFSGKPVNGMPAHKIREFLPEPPQDSGNVTLRLFDYLALETEWLTMGAFRYHNDWIVHDDPGKDITTPDYSELSRTFGIGAGASDDTYEAGVLGDYAGQSWKTVIHKFLSMVRLNEDGGVVILGGRGESITMGRGQVEISAPDGVIFTPGKSFVVLAGDDISLRAKNSLDASGEKDVRIHAGKNLAMAGGDDKEGGVLIEARGVGDVQNYPEEGGEQVKSAGITLKAAKSFVQANGKNIYLRTGNNDGGVEHGNIVLDACKGDADIVQIASKHTRFAKGLGFFDAFGTTKVVGLNSFEPTGVKLYNELYAQGTIRSGSAIVAKSGMVAVNGDFSSRSGGEVGVLRRPGLYENALEAQELVSTENKTRVSTTYDQELQRKYDSQGLGNGELQKSVSFGFRTEADYGTVNNFQLNESPWRTIARCTNAAGTEAWEGLLVKYQGKKDTLAWPGNKSWTETQAAAHTPEFDLFDMSEGRPKGFDGRDKYEAANPPRIQKDVLKSFYRIITTE